MKTLVQYIVCTKSRNSKYTKKGQNIIENTEEFNETFSFTQSFPYTLTGNFIRFAWSLLISLYYIET